jgi:inosine-uridine nucleoside N-ribohydrolase
MQAKFNTIYTVDEPVKIILDTDIGPDCDDAGAIAVLHTLATQGAAEILGIAHCTSNPWGAGCVDALNVFYGRPNIPVSTLKREGFLDDEQHTRYNKIIATEYPNRYGGLTAAPNAVDMYRRLLSAEPDGSVVIVAIGPLPNLSDLLLSEPDRYSQLNGIELVAAKVKHTVIMGGAYPAGREWNYEMDPIAAQYVTAHWPATITFTGQEIGMPILTGSRLFKDLSENHPLRRSYALYLEDVQTRPSWDLTAVLYAVKGLGEWWNISENGVVVVEADGSNSWKTTEIGRHKYLIQKMQPEQVAELLDSLMIG